MGSSFYAFWKYKTLTNDELKISPPAEGIATLFTLSHKGEEIHTGMLSLENLQQLHEDIEDYLNWYQENTY